MSSSSSPEILRNRLLWEDSSESDNSSDYENRPIRAPRNFRMRFDHFTRWSDEEFRVRFRLTKETVRVLEQRFQDDIAPKTARNHAITAMQQILIVLRFCATGCMLQTVGDFAGIHKATASQIVRKMLHKIASLAPEYINMPRTPEEIERNKRNFYRIAKFPRVIGAIDCTHIKIISPGLQDAISKNLLVSDKTVLSARVLAINASTGTLVNCAWWQRQGLELGGPKKITETGMEVGHRPNTDYPWYEDADSSPGLRSPKFVESPQNVSYKGWWTYPYYSCLARRWLISYSVPIPPPGRRGLKGFLSLDVDVSHLEVNQCDVRSNKPFTNEISIFHGSHKCHNSTTECVYRPVMNSISWTRGRYHCICRQGFYSPHHDGIFNGSLVEVAWTEYLENSSDSWSRIFQCKRCAPGCHFCKDPSPCLATYHWPFRITLLVFTIFCVLCTVILNVYMFKHRKLKVFKVASPIFLSITLFGCATMYLEMAAIFPVLDLYSCIATKWSRHLGFCVTYTALLMKTWRVSLTYRVKSAHKVKLTDKQLLQWMVPILLVMLIYLGTWTLSDTPTAEEIMDNEGLRFKQCVYNWWDHSLAIGEVLFLAWGIRVCYNVRNAESLYNEARLISYAIYNIAIVNIMMIAFHLFIFPRAGPDIKYLLGFIRTQLSTSTTIALVFGPKVIRVLRGQGDQWDNRARSRGVTASFSLNGIGLVPEEAPDLYQENEELKEEIQKLAAQIEFMKIVHMEMNNRHVKPKTGGYFTTLNAPTVVHSPLTKQGCILSQSKPPEEL